MKPEHIVVDEELHMLFKTAAYLDGRSIQAFCSEFLKPALREYVRLLAAQMALPENATWSRSPTKTRQLLTLLRNF
jgi:hypothetical protein